MVDDSFPLLRRLLLIKSQFTIVIDKTVYDQRRNFFASLFFTNVQTNRDDEKSIFPDLAYVVSVDNLDEQLIMPKTRLKKLTVTVL